MTTTHERRQVDDDGLIDATMEPPPGGGPAYPPAGERPSSRIQPTSPPSQTPLQQAEPPRPPAQPPQPQKPDEEAGTGATRTAAVLVGLVFLTMVTSTLPLPALVAAPLLGLAAGVIAVRGLITRQLAGRWLLVTWMSLLFVGLTMMTSVSTIALWPLSVERQECLDRALTISAQTVCEARYNERLQGLLGQPPA